eukprot:15365834-Ditylum_brightwellii.AAC.2
MAAARHVGHYLKLTFKRGIAFSSEDHATVTSYLNLHFKEDNLLALCNSNWGPQDVSKDFSHAQEVPMETLWSVSEIYRSNDLIGKENDQTLPTENGIGMTI